MMTNWQNRRANHAPDAVHRAFDVDHAATLKNASATTIVVITSPYPLTKNWQDRCANLVLDAVHRDAALKGPSASPSVTRSPRPRANLLALPEAYVKARLT
jgi:hypothetical protein